jgi:hypothetical protein
MSNPFNITKAVDYTDEELNNYWVDFPGGGFNSVIKPTSTLPMIILGSKGSGKTHIMKYFSFTMQSIRHSENILQGIITDGYLGTFLRCSGLNAFRFNDKGETDKYWSNMFSYYLELWLGQLLLNNINKLLSKTDLVHYEASIVNEILTLFDKEPTNKTTTIKSLIIELNNLQKKIDYSINNWSFTKEKISEKIEILLSPGKLIFGIPKILTSKISNLSDLKFIFLMDEYENFTAHQQEYFNTLIRERKNPTCFKIGSRKYGIKTKSTLNVGEDIKLGSEYEEIDIDDEFRKNPKEYKEFIKQICQKRLSNSTNNIVDIQNYFDNQDLDELYEAIKNKGKKHFDKLIAKLKVFKVSPKHIKSILSNLDFNDDILLERVNILLFYRLWKKGINLMDSSKFIKDSCIIYHNDNSIENDHSRILDKYKYDLIDALLRENKFRINTYIGFNNLVKISNGIPRHFLITIRHIYRWNEFKGKQTFDSKENRIDSETQLNALNDTANWFFEDASISGEEDYKIKDCIERLCDYLRELRFSDTPPECSISSFSINSKVIPKKIERILTFLEQYSYILKIDTGRRNKNYNSRSLTYQVNGLLAFQWELSLARRGVINLDLKDAKTIFFPEDDREYLSFINGTSNKYKAPFNNSIINPTLFD